MYCYRYKQLNNFVRCFYRMCHPCPRWTSSRPFLPPSYRRVSPRCPSSRGVRVSSSRESRSISWSRLREEQPASPKDGSLSSLCYIWLVQIIFSILLLSGCCNIILLVLKQHIKSGCNYFKNFFCYATCSIVVLYLYWNILNYLTYCMFLVYA